jgi:hypothetical protein
MGFRCKFQKNNYYGNLIYSAVVFPRFKIDYVMLIYLTLSYLALFTSESIPSGERDWQEPQFVDNNPTFETYVCFSWRMAAIAERDKIL